MKKQLLVPMMAVLAIGALNAETWRAIGTAQIVDGWITPGYVDEAGQQIDPSTCPMAVEVEECVETPGVYKLINPFGGAGFHLAEFNLDGIPSDIVIDARDRTMVIINPQYCGFTDADTSEPSGRYPYYISDMGTYMYLSGQPRELINLFKCAAVKTDNVIYVPQPTFGTTPDKAIQAWDPGFPATIILPDQSADDSAAWEPVGTAQFIDGWLTPGFTDDNGVSYDPSDYPLTCEVMVNKENPNLYSVVNPYNSPTFHLLPYNLNANNVRLVFDLTDREFVTMQSQFSGYIGRKDNDIVSYYLTDGGTYMLANGYSRDEIIAQGHNSTYFDGVLTVASPLWSFELNGRANMWNNPHAAFIYFDAAGVESAIIPPDDAAPRYYNLQGIEVDTPVKGHIYICRRGTTSSKIVY